MNTAISNPTYLRRRRFLTVLPLLITPFLTIFFWSLGGGRGAARQPREPGGFNANLPEPVLEKAPQDKMAFYERATRDSLQFAGLKNADPYYNAGKDTAAVLNSKLLGLGNSNGATTEHSEQQVMEKLQLLERTLKQPEPEASAAKTVARPSAISADVDRLENMMQSMKTGSDGQDPEMAQISGMLEKVLDIQHPQRVQQRLQEETKEQRGMVYPVTPAGDVQAVTLLAAGTNQQQNGDRAAGTGFFSLEAGSDRVTSTANVDAVKAVVHEHQELVEGATVKLRLLDAVRINGQLIPRDNFLFGIASLNGDRLKVTITHIRYANLLLPVNLAVFDMDGLCGINIPGAISRDAAKQSGDRAVQSMGLSVMDNSLGAQAAAAGIELSRNILSRKVRLIKVRVPAGYQVLLRDEKQQ